MSLYSILTLHIFSNVFSWMQNAPFVYTRSNCLIYPPGRKVVRCLAGEDSSGVQWCTRYALHSVLYAAVPRRRCNELNYLSRLHDTRVRILALTSPTKNVSNPTGLLVRCSRRLSTPRSCQYQAVFSRRLFNF